MATFHDVRRIAMALPEAEEILTWDTDMTFRIRNKIFAISNDGSDRASIKASLATQADLVYRDPVMDAEQERRRDSLEPDQQVVPGDE